MAISANAFGQSAKEALAAIKKLQIKCESGILYKDYSPALNEAKSPVMLYLENPASKNAPAFSQALSNALGHYELANEVFVYMFKGGMGKHFESTQNPALFEKIRQAYPELHIYGQRDGSGFSCAEAIQLMWTKAASEIEKASDNLPTAEKIPVVKKAAGESDRDPENVSTSKLKRQVNALKYENMRLKKENKELRREIERRKKKAANKKKG
ncbi:MAG TPA: hypothetical protein VMU10_05825, partial [Desulfomonilia bacterium]|nr:hypothetical protein [Desulfomonilia bacterium]